MQEPFSVINDVPHNTDTLVPTQYDDVVRKNQKAHVKNNF